MGLDMYARVREGRLPRPVDFEIEDGDEELFYWRKHPDLHGWMEALYYEKGGKSDEDGELGSGFNCVPVELTLADLDRLQVAVLDDNLPATAGFFFGESEPSDRTDDLKFIGLARQAIADGKSVYYTSWW